MKRLLFGIPEGTTKCFCAFGSPATLCDFGVALALLQSLDVNACTRFVGTTFATRRKKYYT